jgi:pyruvate/2-oxoglutarate dehydrogenase complex dihydrolipoamide acyltransferase (E2) component
MAVEVIMPQMGESIFEGTITKWLKKPGDSIDRDEPLFEISTDKVDAEIPSPAAGVLKEIRVEEGKTVPIQRPNPQRRAHPNRPRSLRRRRKPKPRRLHKNPNSALRLRQPLVRKAPSPRLRNRNRKTKPLRQTANGFAVLRWCAAWRAKTISIWER